MLINNFFQMNQDQIRVRNQSPIHNTASILTT